MLAGVTSRNSSAFVGPADDAHRHGPDRLDVDHDSTRRQAWTAGAEGGVGAGVAGQLGAGKGAECSSFSLP